MASQYLGELVAKITGDTTGFDKSIKDTQQKTISLQDKFVTFGKKLNTIGKGMETFGKSMTRKVTLPILAVGVAIIKMAADSDKVLGGKLKGLQDDLKKMAVSFATVLMPVINDAIKFIGNIVKWFTGLDDKTKSIIVGVAGLAAAIGPLLSILGPLTAAFGLLTAVMAANPIGAIIVAIVAATAAVMALTGSFTKLPEEIQKAKDKITANFQGVVEEVSKFGERMNREAAEAMVKATGLTLEERKKIDAEFDDLRKSDLEKELDAIDKKVEYFKKGTGNDLETLKWGEQEKARIRAEFAEREKQEELDRVQAGLDAMFARLEGERQTLEQLKIDNEETVVASTEYQESLARYAANNHVNIEARKWEAINAVRKKSHDEELARQKELQNKIIAFTDQAVGGALSAFSNLNNTRLAQIEQQRDAEGNLSEDLKAEKRRLLEQNKAIAIVQAVITNAQAVMKTFAEFGWPFGIIPAGIMAGIGAAQIAAIAGTPIPALAEGGLIMPSPGGTLVQAAEAGAPEFFVPETQDVMSRLADRISANMNRPNVTTNNNTQMPGNLVIDGKKFNVFLQEQLDNGKLRVPQRVVKK